jgi:hypothetical protein
MPLALPTDNANQTIKRCSWKWIVIQANALRRYGLMARIKELKKKIDQAGLNRAT